MRLATALGALALGAGGLTVTTLPRPAFPGPAAAPSGQHRLVLVSSHYASPGIVQSGQELRAGPDHFLGLPLEGGVNQTGRTTFAFYGRDSASAHLILALDNITQKSRYAFDFKNYVWPPRIRPADREFVYESVVWAHEANGALYVENAHLTYASSSYGQNAYITAIDLKTRKALWRSPALVANANTFLVTSHYLVTGYGFTAEPDYLYLLDRATGHVVDRLLLPNAPEKITWQGKLLHVRTYDHNLLVRLAGA